MHDVAQRGEWNKPASEAYALPTETWREVVARRTRYQDLQAKLTTGKITSVNDLITYNLDSRRFVEDVITYCTGTDLLRALYDSIEQVTVLDPTCGSGAFLFSALGILEGLYEACLERMQDLIEEREALDAAMSPERRHSSPDIAHFRAILERVKQHPSRAYFIYKSIIIRNLYGVDIMEEATEICKLRLFLKLVSQVNYFDDIEPLPDIDFNIRAGNTLVGFTSYDETKKAILSKMTGKGTTREETAFQNQMIFDDRMDRIEQKAQDIERAFEQFRELQVKEELDPAALAAHKRRLQQMLGILRAELNGYLASEYSIDRNSILKRQEYDARFAKWQQSHQPFHWWVEFYGIMKKGGFDVIIGNPPYVEYSEVRSKYRLLESQYTTIPAGNLYAFTWERALRFIKNNGWVSLIIPISSFSTPRMEAFVSLTKSLTKDVWISQYAVRPSKLFVGVDMNLTIVISRAAGHDISIRSHFWTTMYQRWTPNFREFLFANMAYVRVPDEPLPFNFAIPKLRGTFEEYILRKICSNQPISKLVSPRRIQTTQQLTYRTAGGRYYKIFLDRPLASESKSNKTTNLREDINVRSILAVLSSNLWWWYYTLHFDMYNCKDYMIFGFPFSYPDNFEILDSLSNLGKALVDDLFKNAESKIQDYATTGARKQLIFVPSRSKPIINEIDCILATHYGFTDEELDFIINYDIKYRMGRDSTDEEEE